MWTSTYGTARAAFLGLSAASMLGVTVAAGAYAGRFLDRRWDTSPWLTLGGAFLGLIASVFEMLAVMKRADSASAGAGRKR